ncbi:MAG TPA: hydroxymethylbilane synthase [Caulobacteraceae bacterium]|jgi:hydroxymethylbilane synthase|nr:hydroxymethylbilane synthase [Caulobacteraceae bacterium]
MSIVRIGARGSRLSRAQAGQMQVRIAAALGAPPEDADRVAPLVFITTSGDRIQDRRLLEVGGKGLFTKEIEVALAEGQIDCAIHSLKDVPAEQPPGLALAAFPEREDPRDALCSLAYRTLAALPQGARIGTASLRRQAQLLFRRPDLAIGLLRGNVETRLAKLDAGEADAIILAAAGLKRLGMGEHIRELFDPFEAPPAPGQGALAIQTREADLGAGWLNPLRDPATTLAVEAERGAMQVLEGSCRTAIGAHARIEDGRLVLVVEALAGDGTERWRQEGSLILGPDDLVRARRLGLELGGLVREAAGDRLVVV